MSRTWINVKGIVERGHQVASGQAENGSYPEGTIKMQKPFFLKLGLDLTGFYEATLNLSISPYTFVIKQPEFTFHHLEWTSLHPPETFSFSRCQIIFNQITYDGWIYYPHPETKEQHFQDSSILEIIAPFIPMVKYGDRVEVLVDQNEINLIYKQQ